MSSSRESADETKIIQIPSLNYIPDPRGLGCAYFEQMLRYKDNVAQIDTTTGEKDTFDSLLERCIRTAIVMQTKGISSSDIVTICSFNKINTCVPYIAALFLGAKVAALDPTLSLKDVVHLLKQVSPKIIFVGSEAVELLENAIKETSQDIEVVVFGNSGKHAPFEDFLLPTYGESNFRPVEVKHVRDTAIIIFSSGTSGLAKGICISHFALLSQIANTVSFGFHLDVILLSTSLYWITAALFLGVSMMHGLTRLIVPKFDASTIWETIDKFKPTFMFIAPTQILSMYNQGRWKDLHSCSLKTVSVGGGPIMKKQIETVRKAFPKTQVLIAYGQTEVAGYLTTFKSCNPKEIDYISKKVTSCGSGLPGLSFKVIDPETEELLGANQQGEIRVKTDYQLNGYYNLNSSDAWDSDGWIKTGDIGYYDDDGCFYIVDRVKEMLKFQSWHVPPAVLEDLLLTHPDVASAVVIGVPHETDGDHPMAVVVLKKTSSGVSPESIEKFVELRVHDRQRLRAGVKIVDHIPVTPTGKVKRRDIRDLVLRGKYKSIQFKM